VHDLCGFLCAATNAPGKPAGFSGNPITLAPPSTPEQGRSTIASISNRGRLSCPLRRAREADRNEILQQKRQRQEKDLYLDQIFGTGPTADANFDRDEYEGANMNELIVGGSYNTHVAETRTGHHDF
jgi:hypothetical protein